MKIKELMIGDWVLFRHKDTIKPFQVTQIRESAFDGKLDAWAEGGNVGCDCIEPIPLTNEILEKNGFEYYKNLDICGLIWRVNGVPYIFDWCNGNKTLFIGATPIPNPICNVHQLQQAFRLCGLNDLADNFKI